MMFFTVDKGVTQIIEEVKLSLLGVPVGVPTETPMTIEDILSAVADLGEKRDYVIKSILAVFLSTYVGSSDPLWLMIVGNPSSNKTTLVDLLKGHSDVYRLDSMTSNPFSSGQRAKENPQDLLPLLDGKCFVIKEYGTLLGRSEEVVKQLISDLIAIYDGEYSKHSPTRGTVRYEVTFSHIGCVTPMALRARQRYMDAVGPRFLFLRLPPLSDEQRARGMDAMWDEKKKKTKSEIAALVHEFCNQKSLEIAMGYDVVFSKRVQFKLNKLALLISRARGSVINERDDFYDSGGNKKARYVRVNMQVEEPFRVLKQLKKFALCLAVVNGNSQVGESEIAIVRRVVLSAVPLRRVDILTLFFQNDALTARNAAQLVGQSERNVKRKLDELVDLQILCSEKNDNDKAQVYSVRSEFHDFFRTDFLDTYAQ